MQKPSITEYFHPQGAVKLAENSSKIYFSNIRPQGLTLSRKQTQIFLFRQMPEKLTESPQLIKHQADNRK